MQNSAYCYTTKLFCGVALTSLAALSPSLARAQNNDQDLVLDDEASIIVRGEKIQRVVNETSTGTTIINNIDANSAANRDIDDAIDGLANVLANEGFRAPAIRGVDGQGGDRPAITAGAQPRIPLLVDDLSTPSGEASGINQSSMWDIDSIEVARGPQPTSTGRNAIGGAIRVYTNDPDYDLSAAARLRWTDQPKYGGDVTLNLPLVDDQAAVRVVGEYTTGQSYIDNNPVPLPVGIDPNDEETVRLRGKFLLEPAGAPGLRVLISGNYSDIKGPTEGFFSGDIDDLQVSLPFFFSSSYEDVQQWAYAAKVSYEINDSLTLVTRISQLENRLLFENTGETFMGFSFGFTGFDKGLFETETYLQFRDIGPIANAVVGVIYADEDEVGFSTSPFVGFDLTGSIENLGIYGEVEIDAGFIAPGLVVIAGGRFESDTRSRSTDSPFGPVGAGEFDEDVFLPKLGLRYVPSNKVALGYTYSEGFRGGGLDVDITAPFSGNLFSSTTFEGERLRQHEVYFRGSGLADFLDLEIAAFLYNWDDAHVSGSANFPASGDGALGNIPQAEGYGLEVSATANVTEAFKIYGSVGLLETEITQVNATQTAFLGTELPRAPGVTGSAGIRYDSDNGLNFKAQVRFVGDHLSALNQARIPSYQVVDLAIGYDLKLAGIEGVRLEVFVDNLLDERYLTFTEATAFGGLNQVGQPQTFGLAITGSF